MPEPYAKTTDPNGKVIKYWKKADYEKARFQKMGTMAATQSRINKRLGGGRLTGSRAAAR